MKYKKSIIAIAVALAVLVVFITFSGILAARPLGGDSSSVQTSSSGGDASSPSGLTPDYESDPGGNVSGGGIYDGTENSSGASPSGGRSSRPNTTAPGGVSLSASSGGDKIVLEGESGAVPSGTQLKVMQVLSGSGYDSASRALAQDASRFSLYDISLVKNGVEIQPNGWVWLTVPLPVDFDPERVNLYGVSNGGVAQALAFALDDGGKSLVFETQHLSLYAIAELREGSVAENPENTAPGGDVSDPSSSSAQWHESQREFKVQLLDYHPGLPGRDATYHLSASFKGTALEDGEYTITQCTDGVVIDGKALTVSDALRQQRGKISLTLTYKAEPEYKYVLEVAFKQWQLTFSDEFNGANNSAPDSSKWGRINPGFDYIVNGDALTADEQYTGGYLHAGSTVENTTNSSGLASIHKQAFGLWTSSIRLPRVGTSFCAFWMLPTGGGGGGWGSGYVPMKRSNILYDTVQCGEIDIMEHNQAYMPPGFVTNTKHFWFSATGVRQALGGGNYTIPNFNRDRFYEYSFIWTPYTAYVYLDGYLYTKDPNIAPTNSTGLAYIILGSGAANQETQDLKASMDVDWVRVYK